MGFGLKVMIFLSGRIILKFTQRVLTLPKRSSFAGEIYTRNTYGKGLSGRKTCCRGPKEDLKACRQYSLITAEIYNL